jgi:hypothetical protein
MNVATGAEIQPIGILVQTHGYDPNVTLLVCVGVFRVMRFLDLDAARQPYLFGALHRPFARFKSFNLQLLSAPC